MTTSKDPAASSSRRWIPTEMGAYLRGGARGTPGPRWSCAVRSTHSGFVFVSTVASSTRARPTSCFRRGKRLCLSMAASGMDALTTRLPIQGPERRELAAEDQHEPEPRPKERRTADRGRVDGDRVWECEIRCNPDEAAIAWQTLPGSERDHDAVEPGSPGVELHH